MFGDNLEEIPFDMGWVFDPMVELIRLFELLV